MHDSLNLVAWLNLRRGGDDPAIGNHGNCIAPGERLERRQRRKLKRPSVHLLASDAHAVP